MNDLSKGELILVLAATYGALHHAELIAHDDRVEPLERTLHQGVVDTYRSATTKLEALRRTASW